MTIMKPYENADGEEEEEEEEEDKGKWKAASALDHGGEVGDVWAKT